MNDKKFHHTVQYYALMIKAKKFRDGRRRLTRYNKTKTNHLKDEQGGGSLRGALFGLVMENV